MSGFQAREYVPSEGLVRIHNTARVMGSNQFTTEGFTSLASLEGPAVAYFEGLLIPAIIMIIIFILWIFSLCIVYFCCRATQKGSKNVALFFFVLFCTGSLIAWAVGLAGNVDTTQGFNAMINGVQAVQDLSLKVVALADDATSLTNNLYVLAIEMAVICSGPNSTFPFPDVASGLNNSIDAAIGESGIVNTIESLNNQVDDYKALVVQYLQWREVGTMIVIIVTMVVLFIFMLSTALRVMDSTPEACRPCAKVSSRYTSCIVFLFGTLLLLIIWIFVAIIHVLVTFGADLCVPSINSSINRIANEVTNNTFSSADPCLDPGYRASTPGLLCFYQNCQGTNELGALVSPIADNANISFSSVDDYRAQLNATIVQYNISVVDVEQCFNSMDAFFNGTNNVTTLIDRAVNLTTCPEVNPVYATFLYDGLCNGLFDGLVFTYVSCIVACVFMMAAMSIFCIFDFRSYEFGQLPQGYYIDPSKDGQVVNSGGPITQAV